MADPSKVACAGSAGVDAPDANRSLPLCGAARSPSSRGGGRGDVQGAGAHLSRRPRRDWLIPGGMLSAASAGVTAHTHDQGARQRKQ